MYRTPEEERNMPKNYEGLKVLDFTRVLVGPWMTQYLRDNGAEVIKIERPFTGTDERSYTPLVEGKNGVQSGYYMMVNRGKKSVALDLKDPDCREAVRELIKWADVIAENFAPGVMKRMGFGYEECRALNPSVIYISLSTYGQEGPISSLPGWDINAQAMSGLMWMCGEADETPVRDGTSIGDVNATGYALGALGAALYYRSRTGKGQYIDISLRDLLSSELETALTRYLCSGGKDEPIRSGRHHATLAPYGIFDCGKGKACVIVGLTDKTWSAICSAMGESGWGSEERFSTSAGRGKYVREIVEHIERWLKGFDDYLDAVRMLQKEKVPCVPIYSMADLVKDEQWLMRNNLVHVDDPVFGEVDLPATPVIFSETSVFNDSPAPLLGQHTEEVLRDVARLPEEKIRTILKKCGCA